MDGTVGGDLISSAVGLTFCLGGMRCSSVDEEAAGATAKPHDSVYARSQPLSA